MTRTVATSLASLLNPFFDAKTRSRGRQYSSDGSITKFQGTANAVSANVSGTDLYRVTIRYDAKANELGCYCSCPAFERDNCKHLYAVLLAADAKGALSEPRRRECDSLSTAWPDEVNGDDYEYDEDDEDDAHEEAQVQGMTIDLGNGDVVKFNGGPDVLARLLPFLKKTQQSTAFSKPPPAPAIAAWKQALNAIETKRRGQYSSSSLWIDGRQMLYILDVQQSHSSVHPKVDIAIQDRKINGDWSKPRNMRISSMDIQHAPDIKDRKALAALHGLRSTGSNYYSHSYSSYDYLNTPIALNEGSRDIIIKMICDTGRCWLRTQSAPDAELIRLNWDHGLEWKLHIDVQEVSEGGDFKMTGILRRGDEAMPLTVPHTLLRGGLLFHGETASRFMDDGDFEWIALLRDKGQLIVPRSDGQQLAQTLVTMPGRVPVKLPEQLHIEEQQGTPRPLLRLIKADRFGASYADRMHASVHFDYEGKSIAMEHIEDAFLIDEPRRLIRRDRDAEAGSIDHLRSLGFRSVMDYRRDKDRQFEVKISKLQSALSPLIAAGWRVEAEGKPYRSAGAVNIKVASGIDWFELEGQAHFDDQSVELPQLLAALRRGESTILLGDGTIGMLPDEWLKKYGTLAALGTDHDDHVRFKPTQIGLLDALLASMPEATCDEVFQQARKRLREFDGVKPADAPQGFAGELRPYQREGLGWLQFLREFRFGGCLADDMGLGKTIQILAMLEARRQEKEEQQRQWQEQEQERQQQAIPSPSTKRRTKKSKTADHAPAPAAATAASPAPATATPLPRPSLIVLPRSLVFNWLREAEKFTPNLRILDHSSHDRLCRSDVDLTASLSEYDVVLTTYGTLRADAVKLRDVRFDYVILDEAQAVKNASTASAKAVRLLSSEHRLVMTGTPVENRLTDLWSLFEFLNPGMLGSANVFKLLGGTDNAEGTEARQMLSRALRPFILRRKKEQVARDLPARVEQTIYCELEPKQRKLYNQLREHYRKSLLTKIDTDGLNKSKMHVLEALLRLRQAACHPGLIDETMHKEPSAKLEALMPQLEELIAEGHKVLVFSQFTSMLAIVRERLDAAKITHEYLDGQTKDRQACVNRFQNDPTCPLFLISLKAGGVGLNLTAAEHVFLLDPWWNPAVEAQAIDRAHRIGQMKQVFAFRLIARDTVEEKVLELQNSKRELADAIINQDNSLITKLGRKELEMLLS